MQEVSAVFKALAEEAWSIRMADEEKFQRSLTNLETDLSPDEKIEFLREYGKLDLFFFARDILGNQWLTQELHGDISKWVYAGKKWKLLLLPRNSLKTTYLTQIATLHEFVRNPDCRILINSEIHENSKAMLRAIKGMAISCELFMQLYGDLNGFNVGLPWSDEEVVISTRQNLGLKEGSVETAGLDVTKVSRHYTRIVHDDLQSIKNVRSSEAIEKVKETFRLSLPLLEKNAEMWVIGTRWDDQDLYSYIIESLKDKFDTYIRGAYHEGKLIYPTRLDEAELDAQKAVLTPYEFSCQYLNDPIPKDQALLWPDKLVKVEKDEEIKNLNIGMTIDPSLGETKHSDYTGISVGAMDKDQNLILLDGWFGRVDVAAIIKKVVELAKKHKPRYIGVEKVGVSTIGADVYRALKKEKIPCRFTDLKPQGRSKETRIMYLQELLGTGRFKYWKDYPVFTELEYEMQRFPRAKHDDLLDSVAYLPDILRPMAFNRRSIEKKPKEYYRPDFYTGY